MKKIFLISLLLLSFLGCTNTQVGFDKKTMINSETKTKYDKEGYDYFDYNEEGYDRKGFNRSGLNKITEGKYDLNGYDKAGYDKEGYNVLGYNQKGFDRNGNIKVYQVKFTTSMTTDGVLAPYTFYKKFLIDDISYELNNYIELKGPIHTLKYTKYNKNGYGMHLNEEEKTIIINLDEITGDNIQIK